MIRPAPGSLWGGVREAAAKPATPLYVAHCDLPGFSIFEEAHYCSALAALRAPAAAAGATLLRVDLHGFGEGQGVTGVALLAESHVTVHTWLEHGYAACDVLLCGRVREADAALRQAFAAGRCTLRRIERGRTERMGEAA